jgi:glutaredoxin
MFARILFFRLLLIGVLASSVLAQAQQYRWIDEKGSVQYGDAPPASAKKVERLGPKKDDAAAPEQGTAPPLPAEVQAIQKDYPVTLYTSPLCKQPCAQAREALNKRGIPFSEFQVWNEETLEKLKAATGADGVPAIVVGRTAYSGFESARYDAMLDLAGYPKAGVLPPRKQDAPVPPEGAETLTSVEPAKPAPEASTKPGPYDTSGLKSNEKPRPKLYDPSTLPSNEKPKPRLYNLPGESTK